MPNALDKIQRRKIGDVVKEKPRVERGSMLPEEMYDTIPIQLIDVNTNIRKEYDQTGLHELAESMKQFGQLEPIRVYENKETRRYVVIFGHRRLMAGKIAQLKELKCFITKKPDDLETVLIQAIENEHSVNISSSDREKYIKMLNTKFKLSPADIAEKIGKSTAWIYDVLNATKIREKHESTFNKAGIVMTTSDTKFISNATKEDVEGAIEEILEKQGSKYEVLKKLNEKNKKKPGLRTKKIKNEPVQEKEKGRQPIVSFENNESKKDLNPQNDITEETRFDPPSDEPDENTDEPLEKPKKFYFNVSFTYNPDDKTIKFSVEPSGESFHENFISEGKKYINNFLEKNGFTVKN